MKKEEQIEKLQIIRDSVNDPKMKKEIDDKIKALKENKDIRK